MTFVSVFRTKSRRKVVSSAARQDSPLYSLYFHDGLPGQVDAFGWAHRSFRDVGQIVKCRLASLQRSGSGSRLSNSTGGTSPPSRTGTHMSAVDCVQTVSTSR